MQKGPSDVVQQWCVVTQTQHPQAFQYPSFHGRGHSCRLPLSRTALVSSSITKRAADTPGFSLLYDYKQARIELNCAYLRFSASNSIVACCPVFLVPTPGLQSATSASLNIQQVLTSLHQKARTILEAKSSFASARNYCDPTCSHSCMIAMVVEL